MPRIACETCLLRRVYCDSTEPFCQACIEGGFLCPGYASTDSFGRSSQEWTERTHVRPRQTLATRGRRQSTTVLSRSTSRPTSPRQTRQPRSLSVPNNIDSDPHQTRILSVFLDLASPGGSSNNIPAQFAWLQILPTRRFTGEVLPLAISALCSVHLGTTRKNRQLLQAARVHYTTALQKLATAIIQPYNGDYDETFASIMILMLCELFDAIAADGTGWNSHVRGAASFLERHGPSAVESKLGRLLLHNARLSTVYLGALQRQSIFFDTPDWKAITSSAAATDGFTAFVDICVPIPTFMADCNAAATDGDPAKITEMLRRGDAMQTLFATWFDAHLRHSGLEWIATSSCSALSAEFATPNHPNNITINNSSSSSNSDIASTSASASGASSSSSSSSSPFPIIFSFPDLRTACLHMEYWSARLNIARAVSDMVRESGLAPGNSTLLRFAQSTESEVQLCATKVCQCVPFCCCWEEAGAGTSVLTRISGLGCLVLAYEAFEKSGREEQREWCRRVYAVVKEGGIRQPGSFPPASPTMQLVQLRQRPGLISGSTDDSMSSMGSEEKSSEAAYSSSSGQW